MSPNPYLYELLEGFRFPTTEQVKGALAEIQDDEKRYPATLRSDFFTTTNQLTDTVEVFVEDNRITGGMTYAHVLSGEPRQFTQQGGAAKKTTWSGVHFMEFDTVGHEEILRLASLNDRGKRQLLTERVAKMLDAMDLRQKRRENWLCAQILTKGKIEVKANDPENPERVAYTMDYRVKDIEITLDADEKWNHKDAGGNYTADIVEFGLSLNEARDNADLPRPRVFVMNTKTFNEMRRNDVIYKKYWQRLVMGHDGRMESRDIITDPRLLQDQFSAVYQQITGISIEVRDDSVKSRDGRVEKLIPDGHVSILYGDQRVIGEFAYLAHLYGTNDGGKPTLGTGPYLYTVTETGVTNPSYSIFTGFHALPSLDWTAYNSDFEYENLKTVQVL